ncbi:MAG: hypothetical protein ACOH5I_24480 [Oligoflexus sp.]
MKFIPFLALLPIFFIYNAQAQSIGEYGEICVLDDYGNEQGCVLVRETKPGTTHLGNPTRGGVEFLVKRSDYNSIQLDFIEKKFAVMQSHSEWKNYPVRMIFAADIQYERRKSIARSKGAPVDQYYQSINPSNSQLLRCYGNGFLCGFGAGTAIASCIASDGTGGCLLLIPAGVQCAVAAQDCDFLLEGLIEYLKARKEKEKAEAAKNTPPGGAIGGDSGQTNPSSPVIPNPSGGMGGSSGGSGKKPVIDIIHHPGHTL